MTQITYADRPFYLLEIEPHMLPSLLSGELIEKGQNRARFATLRDHVRQHYARGSGWYGGLRSIDQVVELVQRGWAEGAQMVEAVADELREKIPPPKSVRRRPRWQAEGEELDRDRLWAGQFDSMWREAHRDTRYYPKTITVVGAWGAPKSWTGQEVFFTGAALLLLGELLDHAGYNTELLAMSPATMPQGDLVAIARVKEAGDPLRADVIAASFCHPGSARLFDFCATLTAPFDIDPALGTIAKMEPSWKKAVDSGYIEGGETTIVLPRVMDLGECEHVVLAGLRAAIPEEYEDHNE